MTQMLDNPFAFPDEDDYLVHPAPRPIRPRAGADGERALHKLIDHAEHTISGPLAEATLEGLRIAARILAAPGRVGGPARRSPWCAHREHLACHRLDDSPCACPCHDDIDDALDQAGHTGTAAVDFIGGPAHGQRVDLPDHFELRDTLTWEGPTPTGKPAVYVWDGQSTSPRRYVHTPDM